MLRYWTNPPEHWQPTTKDKIHHSLARQSSSLPLVTTNCTEFCPQSNKSTDSQVLSYTILMFHEPLWAQGFQHSITVCLARCSEIEHQPCLNLSKKQETWYTLHWLWKTADQSAGNSTWLATPSSTECWGNLAGFPTCIAASEFLRESQE